MSGGQIERSRRALTDTLEQFNEIGNLALEPHRPTTREPAFPDFQTASSRGFEINQTAIAGDCKKERRGTVVVFNVDALLDLDRITGREIDCSSVRAHGKITVEAQHGLAQCKRLAA